MLLSESYASVVVIENAEAQTTVKKKEVNNNKE
jgi:hypothetical protein